jgi:hypothetical protein
MAIERCPEYLKYRHALLKRIEEPDPEKKLARIGRFPWRPLEFLYLILPPGIPEVDEMKRGLLERFEREAVVLVKAGQWPRGKNEPAPDSVLTLHRGRLFVRLSIDLNKSDEELKKCFMEIVKNAKETMYQGQVVKPGVFEGRTTKKPAYDPWEIYDLHKKKGLSLLEIVHRLSGKEPPRGERTPAYDPELWPPYKRIERAYNQALKMIQAESTKVKSWFPEQPPVNPSDILG